MLFNIAMLEFRTYTKEDKVRLLNIFKSNVPKYFANEELAAFDYFLDHYTNEDYLVVLKNKEIIGCGGHYLKDDFHGIAWVFFARNGIGFKDLLKTSDAFFAEIESRIRQTEKKLNIKIRTSQHMIQLFKRYGFTTTQVVKDGFAIGLDEYTMIKNLD